MPVYEYNALTETGEATHGVLEGDSPRQIRQLLRDQKLTPLDVALLDKAKRSEQLKQPLFSRQRLSIAQLSIVTRQLATLLRAGTPIEASLTAVAEQSEKRPVKKMILALRAKVREGHSLATAMAEYPQVFDDLYRATVESGEHSGSLDFVLERLADHSERQQQLNSKLMVALVYPMALTFVAIVVTAVLLSYVVPKVVQVFENIEQQLPLMTRILIELSDLVKSYGLPVLLLLIVLMLLFQFLLRHDRVKLLYHQWLLKIPLIGRLVRGINTARFTRTFSILTGSGVTALEAMRIAAKVMQNSAMKRDVLAAAERVREGAAISPALQQSGCFPAMTLHLIASGENSGNLEQMLSHAADSQEREFETLTSTFVGLFEPLLIIVMGSVVLFIVVAILLPIFELNQLIKM